MSHETHDEETDLGGEEAITERDCLHDRLFKELDAVTDKVMMRGAHTYNEAVTVFIGKLELFMHGWIADKPKEQFSSATTLEATCEFLQKDPPTTQRDILIGKRLRRHLKSCK